MNEFEATTRVTELPGSARDAYLRRMGLNSVPEYLRYALATGIGARRRGATGIMVRRLLYPHVLGAASKPVILEDVEFRGPGRVFLGVGVVLEQGVVLDAKTDRPRGISLGDGVAIRRGTLIDTGYHGAVSVGAGTTLGAYCELRGSGGLEIGANCLFARNCMVISSTHVMSDPSVPVTDQGIQLRTTRVGDGVWVGANALIREGVVVGPDAVVAANSVVAVDVPAGAIVAGAPARIVRMREGFEPRGAA